MRSDDYSYRLYDESAFKRLEQILILRKLIIGVKDIQRIFNTADTDVVLEVLGKKVNDIDEEVAFLYELKEIVLTFIRQIERADFNKDSDSTCGWILIIVIALLLIYTGKNKKDYVSMKVLIDPTIICVEFPADFQKL